MDQDTDDWGLLRAYVTGGSHEAFGALVERYVGLVFSAARRRVGDFHAAQDQPLANDLFKMDIPDGVQVNDLGHDPPLSYTYKKAMTQAEWDTVIAEARKRKEDELAGLAADDRAVGNAAPAFGAGQWLNSKPLSWADLRGKVVILDFWSEWCGRCRNDLPTTVDIFKDRQSSGIEVIGIHPPGSEIGSIRKVMDEFGIGYPVYIDSSSPPSVDAWGLLYCKYGVKAIPDSILVDGRGMVVAHGPLGKMLGEAWEMAGK